MDDVKQDVVETAESQSSNTAKTISKKKIIIFATLAVLVIAVCIIVAISSSGLNEYETLIYENCKTLQSKMKNPESLKIYDEVFVLKPKDDDVVFSFIRAGGSNSYGGMESDIIVFADSYYLGTYDYINSQTEKTFLWKQVCAGYFEYQMHEMMGADFFAYEYIEIDVDAVRNKLGLK